MKKYVAILTVFILSIFIKSYANYEEFIVTINPPTNSIINIQIKSFVNDTYVIILRDLNKKVIYARERSFFIGNNTELIDISNFTSGLYPLVIMNNNVEYTDTIRINN